MRKVFLGVILMFILTSCHREVAKDLHFRMDAPNSWVKMPSEKELFKNIYRDSAEVKLKSSRQINENFKVLTSYLKYDSLNHVGVNPTIQVQIHDNRDKYLKIFLQLLKIMSSGIKIM